MSSPRDIPERIEDRLIVALDLPSIREARVPIDKLEAVAYFFKIGLWLEFAAGFDALIEDLLRRDKKIFSVLSSKRHQQHLAQPTAILPYVDGRYIPNQRTHLQAV
jgi:hypothetical protein